MSELVALNSQFLVYRDESVTARVDVRFDGDTVWLTQNQLVELFDSSKANISEHIGNVLAEGALLEEATVRGFRTVQTEGTREVDRARAYYNLDMILSVGYRVRSMAATDFRMWATQRLREFNEFGRQESVEAVSDFDQFSRQLRNHENEGRPGEVE
jgi:hypothetical protein